MEVTGFPAAVTEQILKLASINLCPNLSGQICCALMMNPPQEGEPSYALYSKVGSNVCFVIHKLVSVRAMTSVMTFDIARDERDIRHNSEISACDGLTPTVMD